MRFPEITVSGTPRERGYAHGTTLAAEIKAALDYYSTIFNKSSSEILESAELYRGLIRDYNPAFCEEIEGIAAGAKIGNPLWIYALNARSEILSLDASRSLTECTTICFQPAALLGQNWDWGRDLEQLAVLMRIKLSEDHIIQMLTEPGMIGKIGLNSFGIGACLNILFIDKPLTGVPIHIVLRSILESRTLEESLEAVRKSGAGKASSILFGDRTGKFFCVEFAGDETFLREIQSDFLIHTNHFLERAINPDRGDFRNSYARYRTANRLASHLKEFTIDELKAILTDRSDREHPIYRTYQSDADLQEVGTVATVIMDLQKNQLHVRKGNLGSPGKKSKTAYGQDVAGGLDSEFTLAFN